MIKINYFPRVIEAIVITLYNKYFYCLKFNDNLEVQFSISQN